MQFLQSSDSQIDSAIQAGTFIFSTFLLRRTPEKSQFEQNGPSRLTGRQDTLRHMTSYDVTLAG